MFRFKQFTIQQDRCAMKVGTDGVLLGAWAGIGGAQKVLDIGTGTGLIALMCAQRNNKTSIDAIEIDKDAYEQALDNVRRSPWEKRIQVYATSLQDYQKRFSKPVYDHIISNPPYFQKSFKSLLFNRNQARHTDSLSYEELLKGVAQLLLPTGVFSVILPVDSMDSFLQMAKQDFNLHCQKCTLVKGSPNKPPKRVLMSLSYGAQPFYMQELYIGDGRKHPYTVAYKELTKDFYLAF